MLGIEEVVDIDLGRTDEYIFRSLLSLGLNDCAKPTLQGLEIYISPGEFVFY